MELFKLILDRANIEKEVSATLNETDLAFIARYAFFYRRRVDLGKKIMNLLCQINDCTMEELIDNFKKLYSK